MQTKTRPARIKTVADEDSAEDAGVFEALVATYDPDSVGDRIVPGAFGKTLAEWAERGDPIPVLWSHMHTDPDYHIGVVEQAKETDDGLWVRARLDLDEPKASKIYKLLKGNRVTQFSFAYDIIDGGPVEAKQDGTDEDDPAEFELRELKLYEVGPCLIGANERTELLAVKSAVRSHSTSTSDEAWDGPAMEARLSNDAGAETYRRMYAWNDPDADADTKAAWRFPHHMVSADGTIGAANISACTTGIAILNGSRGGTNIPDSDRQGVYNHLARHLRDADVEPPELRSASARSASAKSGRALSAKNEGRLRDARDLITEVLSALDSADEGSKTQAMPDRSATSEEPPAGAKDDTPAGPGAASVHLRTDLDLLAAEVHADIPRG